MTGRAKRMIALAALPAAAVAMALPAAGSAALTQDERDTLVSLRVEEKLAYDTYATLYEKTGLTVFQRIMRSEAQHSRVLERQLAANGLADPTDGMKRGVFPDAATTKLYRTLVAKGSTSDANALLVGRTIEKLDIRDLTAARTESSDSTLDRVYSNLIRASKNHLRAFSRSTGTQAGGGGAQSGGGGGGPTWRR